MSRLAAVLTAVALLALAACGGVARAAVAETTTQEPSSIVVLGDSIASGEGINYGYTYYTGFPNHWIGGTKNPTWAGKYPLCHQSLQAYGDLVATAFEPIWTPSPAPARPTTTASSSTAAPAASCIARPSSATG